MTPERWQQIRDVLEKALELAPGQRSSFLDGACLSDQSLRREVETLLASSEDARSGFLESSPLRVTITSGTKLGEYEVKSLLGSGGMGEVYRARDSRLGRDVAIKVLPSFLSTDSDRLRRFEQEARAAAALNHPNILAVFQMGTYQGAPYLVSELLEGETLREQIKRGRLAARKAIDYGVQIARGLAAAHEKGIAHRDLKPENLFVTKDGRVKILDFGLAKLMQPQSGSDDNAITLTKGTEAGMVMGTVGYMAPEQVRGQTADHRADIFAFGAILYEMLAGKRAFQKPTSAETMTAILNEDPPGISQVTTNLPPALQRVVHRCLEKNLEQRFQSASDLAFALDALSENDGSTTAYPRNEGGETGRFGFFAQHQLWAASGLVFVGLLLAIAATGIWHWRSKAEAPQIESIAVIPFATSSGDDKDFISDGLTESLIASLTYVPQLKVKSRNSVFRFKGKDIDVQQVGRDLTVDALLTGRVMQHGDTIQVSTELTRVQDNTEIWGEHYERKASDVIGLQKKIAGDIAGKLRSTLSGAEKQQVTKQATQNPEAYELYVKGRYYWNKRTNADLKTAISYFNQAIDKDPTYALAYSGLADAYNVGGSYGMALNESVPKAMAAAQKALELDPTLARPHAVLGANKMDIKLEFSSGEAEFRKAIELDASDATTHQWFAEALSYIGGRAQESIDEANLALQLDPLSPIIGSIHASVYAADHQFDKAIEFYQKVIADNPSFGQAHAWLADAYWDDHKYVEAIQEYKISAQLLGDKNRSEFTAALDTGFRSGGWQGALRKGIEVLLTQRKARTGNVSPYQIAELYADLGDKEHAFEWLNIAYQESDGLIGLRTDFPFDSLRSDPRYEELVRKIGFPQ
jgi:eukaryotic-like serine/threonine-protein kinase